MTEVHFRATCSETRLGWHVRVVGNCAALGNWDPHLGAALATSEGDFPLWQSAETVPLEEHQVIEYKYVICDEDGRAVRWENIVNRTLYLASVEGVDGESRPKVVVVSERWDKISQVNRLHVLPRKHLCTDGQGLVEFLQHLEALSLFEPTMRERRSERSCLGTPRLSSITSRLSIASSLSNMNAPSPLNPEVANPCIEESCSAGSLVDWEGLVREESCSHLYHGSEESDDDFDNSAAARAFTKKYMLTGTNPLGEGTFGQVWRCARRSGRAKGEIRAAKMVRKMRLNVQEREFLLGEDGEISTHLTMKHPHIVELLEYFDEPQMVTMILEFCHGGDLFDAIVSESRQPEALKRGGGLSERQSAVVAQHILTALAYIHGQQVVHRDIKCENVLLALRGVPLEANVFKLCDFGFAAHDRGEGLRHRIGSPDTVAPEIVAGKTYSFSADMWSMGTLIYMMLAATPPFKAPTDADVLRKVRAGTYSLNGQPWDSISAPPKHVVTALMVVEPRLRPTARDTLKKAWFADMPAAPSGAGSAKTALRA